MLLFVESHCSARGSAAAPCAALVARTLVFMGETGVHWEVTVRDGDLAQGRGRSLDRSELQLPHNGQLLIFLRPRQGFWPSTVESSTG